MIYITPAKFKKILSDVVLRETYVTGKGYDFNVEESTTYDNGRHYKVIMAWLIRSKELVLRVDYMKGEVKVVMYTADSLHRYVEWGVNDLLAISRAAYLARKILEQVAEVKGG